MAPGVEAVEANGLSRGEGYRVKRTIAYTAVEQIKALDDEGWESEEPSGDAGRGAGLVRK